MQTTHHTTLFTHPQITPITQIKLCVSARGYCPQITPITQIQLCGSARETLTADYTDYTDKLCELFSPSRKEPLRLCAGISS